MKKLVCLGLVALLAVQTTACGVNAQESDTGNIVVEDIGEAEDKLPERNLKDDRLEQVTESGKLIYQRFLPHHMEVVDNASDENNENTRRKATVVPIKIEYV